MGNVTMPLPAALHGERQAQDSLCCLVEQDNALISSAQLRLISSFPENLILFVRLI
jgi:hypothetical protein